MIPFSDLRFEGPLSLWRPGIAVEDDRERLFVLAPGDGLAPAGFERLVRAWAEARPDVEIFHGDDLALGARGTDRVRLKPAFNLPLLIAQDYVGAPLIVRGSALSRLGPPGEDGDLHRFLLQAAAAGAVIERIPEVLLVWPGDRAATPAARRRATVRDWIGERPFEVVDGRAPGALALLRRYDDPPPVTLVVPTRQSGPAGAPYIGELLDSLEATDWPMDRLTVLVGDDASDEAVYAAPRPFRLVRMATPRAPGEAFNYAAKMNRLWRAADTERLVLMNDDVTAPEPGWLKALMTWALEPDVGGVGARLVFPDGRLQHAGVLGGLFGAVAHPWFGQPGEQRTYQDWALVQREWSMVTGAVFATSRTAMEAVGGFDERLTLEFNDLDLCLRMRLIGLRIVCDPMAEMRHREKASRGEALPAAEEIALFLNRWRDWLAADPAGHPRLARDRFALEPAPGADETPA